MFEQFISALDSVKDIQMRTFN